MARGGKLMIVGLKWEVLESLATPDDANSLLSRGALCSMSPLWPGLALAAVLHLNDQMSSVF